MNVYEEAHNLARAIKESQEFAQFDQVRREVEADENLSTMIGEFQNKQMEFQTKQLAGEQLTPEMMSDLQGMTTMLMGNPKAAEFLQAEARFAIMMKDVYEILAEPMNLKK